MDIKDIQVVLNDFKDFMKETPALFKSYWNDRIKMNPKKEEAPSVRSIKPLRKWKKKLISIKNKKIFFLLFKLQIINPKSL